MMQTEICWKCPTCARTRDFHAEENLVMVICPGCQTEMKKSQRYVYNIYRMPCKHCGKSFPEELLHAHHVHPRFMDNEKGNGRKTYLCKACHDKLHFMIPAVMWRYFTPDVKKVVIDAIIKFTDNYTQLKEENGNTTTT